MRRVRRLVGVGAFLGAGVATLAACVAPHLPGAPRLVVPDQVRVRVDGRIRSVTLEEYVIGSALSEVSPVTESAATARRVFEVQTVLARTYAATHAGRHGREGFDLCDTTHCQLYEPARLRTSRFAQIARDAAATTEGRVLAFGARLADALYHADCGGHTASGEAVWGGAPVAYLQPVRDVVPALAHRRWDLDVTNEQLRRALIADPRTDVGRRLDAVRVVRRDASDRAVSIAIDGERTRTVRGEDFRAVVNRALGIRAIQSTRFKVARPGSAFRFDGSGFGHGVGLCQLGAAARARRGDSVGAILAVYFKGAKVIRFDSGGASN